jgi:hypothetical protein
MPTSSRENKKFVRTFVQDESIQSVLDVGAGAGTYFDFLSDLVDYLDAVEVWDRYIERFDLRRKYRRVFDIDIRGFETDQNYDLITCGDVLEHLYPHEAERVFETLKGYSKFVLVSVPIIKYPQGTLFGNHHEIHLIEDALEELIPRLGEPYLEQRYKVTGTFIYRGDVQIEGTA